MVADDPVPPGWDTADAERPRAVRRVLTELQASERDALELAYYGGMSYSEIAARTGESPETLKSRITHALMKLRAALTTLEG